MVEETNDEKSEATRIVKRIERKFKKLTAFKHNKNNLTHRDIATLTRLEASIVDALDTIHSLIESRPCLHETADEVSIAVAHALRDIADLTAWYVRMQARLQRREKSLQEQAARRIPEMGERL